MSILLVVLVWVAGVWLGWELRSGYTKLPADPDTKDTK